jgi:hypothetical protein
MSSCLRASITIPVLHSLRGARMLRDNIFSKYLFYLFILRTSGYMPGNGCRTGAWAATDPVRLCLLQCKLTPVVIFT